MAYTPISGLVPQLAKNAGGSAAGAYYLKGYVAGDTAPLSMGTDSTPTATLAKCKLNSRGEPISNDADETTVFIPHFNAIYKLALYVNATDADANTTANALWVVDNISGVFDASTITYNSTTVGDYLDSQNVADYAAARANLTAGSYSLGDTFKISGYSDAWEVMAGSPPLDTGFVLVGGSAWAQSTASNPIDVRIYEIFDDDATDNSAAWAKLLVDAPRSVHFSYADTGTYKFLSSSNHSSDMAITCDPGVVIDCSDASFSGTYWTKFAGLFPQIENLSANAVKGARSVTFASAPTLVADDVFVIFNPTASSFSGFRTSYYAGEYCKVASVSGNVVTLEGELYAGYAFGSVDIYRLDGIKVDVDGIFLKGGPSTSLLNLEFCRGSVLSNVSGFHENNSIVSIKRCYDIKIAEPSLHNAGDGGSDYGINIGNSQVVKIDTGTIYARRHPINVGGDDEIGSVPCRDFKFIALTLSNDENSTVHCADFHGNAENCQYIDCTIYGGAVWRGKNNGYVNCRIGALQLGACILGAEILGGMHYARGCDFYTIVDPETSSRGVIDVGGNTSAVSSDTAEDCTFEILDCRLNGENLSSSTSLFKLRNRGTVKKLNVKVDGIEVKANDFARLLLTSDDGVGTADSDFFIIDNVTSNLTGKPLVTHSASAYLNFPHKLQRQDGKEELTTSTGASFVTGTAVVFKWSYPRTPVISMSRTGVGYIGNRIGVALAVATASTGLTPRIATDDGTNFSTADNVDINWSASINEV